MPPPRSRPLVVRSVRTPEALDALRSWLDEFEPGTRQRGREYFQQGAVRAVWCEADHHFKAEVRGNETYLVTEFYTRGTWSSRCSCPVGVDCKHAYAAGLAWLAHVEAGRPDGRDPADAAAINFAAAAAQFAAAGRVPARPAPPTHALEHELSGWLRALPTPEESATLAGAGGAAALAGLAGLRARVDEAGQWHIEIRPAADKPWRAPAQRWLDDLARLRPADFEGMPPAEAALANVLAAELRLGSPHFSARRPLPAPAVVALLRTRAARDALARPDGSAFVIEAEALRFQAEVSARDREQLELTLLAPDGREVEPVVRIARHPEALYLFEGKIWRGPPPVPSNRLPVAALSDPRLLPRLRAAGLRLPAELAAEVRVVTLRPRLRCRLAPSPDGGERDFQAELTAASEHPPCVQQWSAGAGWVWRKDAAPPAPVAGEPLWDFDLSLARGASACLGGLRLTWDGWAEAWTRPVGANFPEEFLAWHATLPETLEVELTPELASLFGAPLRAEVSVGIEAAPDSGQDWFDLTVGLKVAETTLSPDEIALLLKARGKWVNLPRHGWRRLEADIGLDAAATEALDRLGLGVTDVLEGGRPARHRLHALQLALEAEALAARDEALAHVLQDRAARLAALPPARVPEGLRATLRPYQVEGYQFLAHLSAQGFGGVLADDMGLGKTVQTLAWILHLRETDAAATTDAAPFRVLVVCPKSVTHGWLAETARFAPGLAIAAFDPLKRGLPEAEIVVANYTQLRLHAARFRTEAWAAVVLDEGQFIKNPRSLVAVAARSLRARRRVVLTGTPIENRLADLWSLFAFAQPGLLGDQAGFRRQYPEAEPAALARLHRRVRHFLLRRTKAQAAPDLPARTEDEIVVELEGEQRRLYEAELKRARAHLLGVETKSALDAVRFHVLASLLRLRQICCHPALIDEAHADLPSAKLDALMERIEELAEEGHQVLVFSQFVEMLYLIRARLEKEKIGHLILTGSTENRSELVDTFQT
ncbi:MAG: SNF2-related protein, partial [Opitutaceae bacterium]|nr:SNF2-related protein [Opitutaceae bacterium]